MKDASATYSHDEDGKHDSSQRPFGLPRRISTGPLSAGLNGPPSPWCNLPPGPFAGLGQTNGPLNNTVNLPAQRRPAPQRGESRFRSLMSKEESEVPKETTMAEQASFSSLGQLNEEDSHRVGSATDRHGRQRPLSGDTDPFSRGEMPSGSAAVGGAHEESYVPTSQRNIFGTTHASHQSGLSSFSGLAMMQDAPAYQQQGHFPIDAFQPQHEAEPLSPTITNPYQSPERGLSRLNDADPDELDLHRLHLPGLGAFGNELGSEAQLNSFHGRNASGVDPRLFERAQQPGFGSTRVLPGLGNLGALGSPSNWSTDFGAGTPQKERISEPFAGPRRSFEELHAPGLGPPGGASAYGHFGGHAGPVEPTSAFRNNRLGSLFPSGMQEQMLGDQGKFRRELAESVDDARGALEGNNPSAGTSTSQGWPGHSANRDTDSPFHAGHGKFDDVLQSADTAQEPSPGPVPSRLQPIGNQSATGLQHQQHQSQLAQQQQSQPQGQQSSQAALSNPSSQLPAAQQKQMVMPDRIRWIYRDPQGNTQGPWSGLEMHDWYRAGFFSPELLVKKAEDTDYEPLAQLIRRIGNSREPFLVPQIGIPAPIGTQTGGSWPPQNAPQTAPSSAPSAQPPFANSFPSFGTTLTAEQQNALERRKQEEQYLMARQKEHLAQQQVMAKQMQISGGSSLHPQQLQHHSSAQSLQSQPSYGSITSPSGFPGPSLSGAGQTPQTPQTAPANSGSYENLYRSHGSMGVGTVGSGVDSLGHIREQEPPSALMERIGLGRLPPTSLGSFGRPQQSDVSADEQRAAAILADRAGLQREQAESDTHRDLSAFESDTENRRLNEFRSLHNQPDESHQGFNDLMGRYAEESRTHGQQPRMEQRQDSQVGNVPDNQERLVEPSSQWTGAPKQKQRCVHDVQSEDAFTPQRRY